ncbi:MAG TPA: ThuA domain-containing protein [Mycobacteriales bacterium]|nr:ThuA domain-containing protein [Mycobacteriales bacterium]
MRARPRSFGWRLLAAMFGAAVVAGLFPATTALAAPGDPTFKVLVFSKTTGFRHDSIPAGVAAIRQLGQDNNFTVDATEDATVFTDANLAQYNAVVFVSTTGDPLDQPAEKDAFQRYIEHGGGFVGVHAASDSGYTWPWYGQLVGAYFKQHPAIQPAVVKVEDPAHPSTKDLPTTMLRTDEWYDYQTDPRGKVHVLTSLDEKTYSGGTMGADHPNTWCQDFDGGRSWYTGLGHTIESFSEPNFLHLLLGGIQTAAGAVPADCSASQDTSFQKVTLDDNTSNPMMLDVAPDGRVFYIDRLGDLKVIKPTGGTTLAAHLNVFTANESGLLGLALDPNFASTHWVYLYYSPNGSDVDRLSRFTVTGDTVDLSSEKVVLSVPVQRAECCHHGGGMVFDPKTGDLWLANGDNTNPFASDGYAPIDERAGRSSWDAQRTAANTNDLRGKLLRIHPETDGTYTVPAGNLFPPGTAQTKPEIYAMGFRNPFRIGIDPKTGRPLVANYGPDAGTASATRGPENTVEWDLITRPGFYGWPYCIGNNAAYRDYDFGTGASGPAFDCSAPVNNSPNNTGLTQLPAAVPATVWYHYAAGTDFPELGGGGAPMAGPTYRYDPDLVSTRKWPAYWDGKAIFAEWNQNKMYSFQLNEAGDKLVDINPILSSVNFLKPMDMKFGPDGALYLIEWGSGFGGDNTDSAIYRIDYVAGSRAPVAKATADHTSGPVPLAVQFSSAGSSDPDGTPITYAWDFDGNGSTDSTEQNPAHTYATPGNFSANLTVTDASGQTGTASVPITVGNTQPTVTLTLPPNGGFFDFGDQVKYTVTVTDPEDGTIDCTRVHVQAILGHESHGHPLDQYTGCSGTVQTTLSSGHSEGDNIFYVLEASYTDNGGSGGAGPLTGRSQAILQPKRKQAEFFTATGRVPDGAGTGSPGVQAETAADPQGGGQDIGFIEDGDYWTFDPTNVGTIDQIRFRAASAGGGGTIEIRAGSATGTLLGSAPIPDTGGWQTYNDYTTTLANQPTASGPLFFVVRRPAGSSATGGLLNVNWVDFIGRGVTDNQRPLVTLTATPTAGTAPVAVSFNANATDPDGNTPLTYEWDFGVPGSPRPTTPAASYTYTSAGTYTAMVMVTDSRGASTHEQVTIRVAAPNTSCLGQKSDDFTGSALDRTRWPTVIRESQDLTVRDGSLHIPTTNTDIYGAGTGTTPNIVLQPAPSGPWQATTKLTLAARDAYQQAGLVVYGDDENYAKMVLEGRGTADANARIFQFIREEAGTPNEVAASNTANLGAAYPDTVYVRFISNGTTLTAWYSADGTAWTQMPETKALAGITNPKIGLISLSGTGTRPVVDAAFDWFQLLPDSTATVDGPSDEFDGTALNGCRWDSIVREDQSGYRVTGGNLEIDTTSGDIYNSPNGTPKNFILQKAPAGDWTAETKVDGSTFNEAFQQGGLIAYADDGNYVKFDFITTNTAGAAVARGLELRSEIGDVVQNPQPSLSNITATTWWLRLVKQGTTYRGFYSSDGTNWTELGAVTNTALGTGSKLGLYAFGVNQAAAKTARFAYFHLGGADTAAPLTTATAAPATPNGQNGWYVTPVAVTLAGSDENGGSGLDRTEYQLDGGAFTVYTAPVTISADGTHALSYRSVDKAGNVEAARSLTFKVDATAPATTAAFAPANDDGWHARAIPVSLSSTDSTSGVDRIEWSLSGGSTWTPYTGPVDITGDGVHELLYRAVDKAGNVETLRSAVVKIDGTKPTVLVGGVAEGQLYGDSQESRITFSAVDPTSGVKTLTGALNGNQFLSGTLLAMFDVPLGQQVLTVHAVDKAGNVTDQTVRFYITTSTRDIANLIDRFKAVGRLSSSAAKKLQDQLTKARLEEARSHDAKEIAELKKFISLITRSLVPDAEVRTVLVRDANAMIVRLGGTPTSGGASNGGHGLSGCGRLPTDRTRIPRGGRL